MTDVLSGSYVKPRGGIGELPARLRAEDCTIAYLGASVTAQKDGFRPRLHELLCRDTGRDHRAVTAALGATGAITGVFLMDELALRHRPDLAFVEYATSDVVGTTPPHRLAAVLEGIVGKLRAANCEPCFLYLHRSDVDIGASDVVAVYEDVADHHAVPSIDVAGWLRRDGDERTMLRDVVHTTTAGSQATAEAIHRALAQIPSASRGPNAPLRDTAFLHTRIEPPSAELVAEGAHAEGRFRLVYPYVEIDRDAELRFTTNGELVGLLVVLGPHSGRIEVTTEGTAVEYLLWDDECSYERLGSVVLDAFAPAGSEVAIRVTDTPVDRSTAKRPVDADEAARPRLKLAGLLVLA